jgi:hypothetical protein
VRCSLGVGEVAHAVVVQAHVAPVAIGKGLGRVRAKLGLLELLGVPYTSAVATWPATQGSRPLLRCDLESGEVRAAVADVEEGVTRDVVYGPATEVRGSTSRGEQVRVVLASVGTVPARGACRLGFEAVPDLRARGCDAVGGAFGSFSPLLLAAVLCSRRRRGCGSRRR